MQFFKISKFQILKNSNYHFLKNRKKMAEISQISKFLKILAEKSLKFIFLRGTPQRPLRTSKNKVNSDFVC